MFIVDLYSKRQRRLRGDVPDVFTYDEIPRALRVQIAHIWSDAINAAIPEDRRLTNNIYKEIHDILRREYGELSLLGNSEISNEFTHYIIGCHIHERVLDLIEVVFGMIDSAVREEDYQTEYNPKLTPDEAIQELNARFLEHGIGYYFESGILLRKDSELIHSEVVKPTLRFLSEPAYQGANEEFLRAHEHYRHSHYKESLNECLKAFESAMKTICQTRSWAYKQTDTAKTLIQICFDNGLIPAYLQSQITALKAVLESGIPTVRNKLGGHGQGAQQTTVPAYMASYTLHLTATTILLLVEAEKQLP